MEITDPAGSVHHDPVWHVADITIGEFLHTLFGYEISENSVLRLDGKEIASTPDTIAATALLAPVVAGDGPDAQVVSSRAVYSIGSSDREIREVMLNMAAERVDDRLISVRINAMLSAMPMAPFRAPASEESMPQARTVILGVPLRHTRGFFWLKPNTWRPNWICLQNAKSRMPPIHSTGVRCSTPTDATLKRSIILPTLSGSCLRLWRIRILWRLMWPRHSMKCVIFSEW